MSTPSKLDLSTTETDESLEQLSSAMNRSRTCSPDVASEYSRSGPNSPIQPLNVSAGLESSNKATQVPDRERSETEPGLNKQALHPTSSNATASADTRTWASTPSIQVEIVDEENDRDSHRGLQHGQNRVCERLNVSARLESSNIASQAPDRERIEAELGMNSPGMLSTSSNSTASATVSADTSPRASTHSIQVEIAGEENDMDSHREVPHACNRVFEWLNVLTGLESSNIATQAPDIERIEAELGLFSQEFLSTSCNATASADTSPGASTHSIQVEIVDEKNDRNSYNRVCERLRSEELHQLRAQLDTHSVIAPSPSTLGSSMDVGYSWIWHWFEHFAPQIHEMTVYEKQDGSLPPQPPGAYFDQTMFILEEMCAKSLIKNFDSHDVEEQREESIAIGESFLAYLESFDSPFINQNDVSELKLSLAEKKGARGLKKFK